MNSTIFSITTAQQRSEILPFLLFSGDQPIRSFVGIKQRLMTLQFVKNVQ